ncbi:hypothetical protein [Mycolicibacterium sarraceniae]|nr:hypothetical protein [Mycolicibacterium sarraceniae]
MTAQTMPVMSMCVDEEEVRSIGAETLTYPQARALIAD